MGRKLISWWERSPPPCRQPCRSFWTLFLFQASLSLSFFCLYHLSWLSPRLPSEKGIPLGISGSAAELGASWEPRSLLSFVCVSLVCPGPEQSPSVLRTDHQKEWPRKGSQIWRSLGPRSQARRDEGRINMGRPKFLFSTKGRRNSPQNASENRADVWN